MAAHILTVIDQYLSSGAGHEDEEMELHFLHNGVSYAPFGRLLSFDDYIEISVTETLEIAKETLRKMRGKYEKLWKLAGEPRNFEEWNDFLSVEPGTIPEYWITFHEPAVKLSKECGT